MKVKFPKEQIDLLNNIGTIVNTADGSVYKYLPFWFKETDEEGIYELFTFEQLPDELIETIKSMRDSSRLSQQSEIVRQRLHYHFAKVDGGWNIEGMNAPFMKEFLNEVQKLVDLSK